MFCTAVLLSALLAFDEVDNPDYQRWAAFAPGSWVILKRESDALEQRHKLLSRTADKVVVEYQSTTYAGGRATVNNPYESSIPAKTVLFWKPAKTGKQELELGGKKLACAWREWPPGMIRGVERFKEWEADEVPGRIVRTEKKREGQEVEIFVALRWEAVTDSAADAALKGEKDRRAAEIDAAVAEAAAEFEKAFDGAITYPEREKALAAFSQRALEAGAKIKAPAPEVGRRVLQKLAPRLERRPWEISRLVLSLPASPYDGIPRQEVLTPAARERITADSKRTVDLWVHRTAAAQHDAGLAELKAGRVTHAMALFEKAAAQGHAGAKQWIAKMPQETYLAAHRDFTQGDFARAWELATLSADYGKPEAVVILGVIAVKGKAGPVDEALALKCFRKGMEAGILESAYNMGDLLAKNVAEEKDARAARKMVQAAADSGNTLAMTHLSILWATRSPETPEDMVVARYWGRIAAEKGSENAAKLLKAYEEVPVPAAIGLSDADQRVVKELTVKKKSGPLAPEEEKRLEELNQRALAGKKKSQKIKNPAAQDEDRWWAGETQRLLGLVEESHRIFEPLGAKGFTLAYRSLAEAYLCGDFPKDPEKSLAWAKKGADGGDLGCLHLMGTHALLGTGGRDEKAAFRWHRRAADAGWVPSMPAVAAQYRDGTGVEKDVHAARAWFQRAAAAGEESAPEELRKLVAPRK